MIGKTVVRLPKDGGGSGIVLYSGYSTPDVMYISNNYHIKTLQFSDGGIIVKAIRLLYSRTGKQIGEAFSGYVASSASELLSKYPHIR